MLTVTTALYVVVQVQSPGFGAYPHVDLPIGASVVAAGGSELHASSIRPNMYLSSTHSRWKSER